jgi:hypothetical protein
MCPLLDGKSPGHQNLGGEAESCTLVHLSSGQAKCRRDSYRKTTVQSRWKGTSTGRRTDRYAMSCHCDKTRD